MSYLYLTPNYASRRNDPAFDHVWATIVHPSAVQQHKDWLAKDRTTSRQDLTLVDPLILSAAEKVVALVANKALRPQFNCPAGSDEFRSLKGFHLADTYVRHGALREAGHFDAVQEQIAGAVLLRAERMQGAFPEPLNSQGLALLDMLLMDAVRAIKPLLAKQVSMLDEVAQ